MGLLRWLLLSLVVAFACTPSPDTNDGTRPVMAMGSRPPIIPTSWTQAAWFIDPSAGNDNNSGTVTGSPLKTWQELVARWGTISPRLRQNTTITFKTNHTDTTDPVYFTPFVEAGAQVIIQGTLTSVATGTLLTVTAKTRATPQLLNVGLGNATPGAPASGQLLINSTRVAHGWVYTNSSGSLWNLTQPLAAITIPTSVTPSEIDTYANGDSYSLNTLTQVNLAVVAPQITDFGVSGGNKSLLYVYQIQVPELAGSNISEFQVNQFVRLQEVRSDKAVMLQGYALNDGVNQGFSNSYLDGSIHITDNSGTTWGVFGGLYSRPTGQGFGTGPIFFDADAIVGSAHTWGGNAPGGGLGCAYLASGVTAQVVAGRIQVAGLGGCTGGPFVWGPGALVAVANGHINYPSGANKAVATFLQSGALKINGATTACSHTGAAPDVLNCGITLSAANLDAAAGAAGFGGNAFLPGGASISNF